MVFVSTAWSAPKKKTLAERLAEDAEAMARINTPVAPTTTPTLNPQDYAAQAPPVPAQGTSAMSATPATPIDRGPSSGTTHFDSTAASTAGYFGSLQKEAAAQKAARAQALQDFTQQVAPLVTGSGQLDQMQRAAIDAYREQQLLNNTGSQNLDWMDYPGTQLPPPFGGDLPNMEQRLGRTGSGNAFMDLLSAGLSTPGVEPTLGFLDKYVGKPLDAYSETGLDAITSSWGNGSPLFAGFQPTANPSTDITDAVQTGSVGGFINKQAEDFRDRSTTEQIIAGLLIDPSAVIPGFSLADDVVDLARIGRSGLKTGREFAGAAIEAGAKQAATPPTFTERIAAGALDPSTGRAFDVVAPAGGAPSTFRQFSEEATEITARARLIDDARDHIRALVEEPTIGKADRPELRVQRREQANRIAEVMAKADQMTPQELSEQVRAARYIEDKVGAAPSIPQRLKEEVTPDEFGALVDEATLLYSTRQIDDFEAGRMMDGLETIFSKGEYPEPAQVRLLSKLLGDDWAKGQERLAGYVAEQKQLERAVVQAQDKAGRAHNAALRKIATNERRMAEAEARAARLENNAAAKTGKAQTRLLEQAKAMRDKAAELSESGWRAEQAELNKLHAALPVVPVSRRDLTLQRARDLANRNSPKLNAVAVTPEQKAVLDYWRSANEVILGRISDGTSLGRRWSNVAAGNFSDSLTNGVLLREEILRSILVDTGMDPEAISKFARGLTDVELSRRYGPIYLAAKRQKDFPKSAARFAADEPEKWAKVNQLIEDVRAGREYVGENDKWQLFVQRAKNTAYGLDLGYGGQQGLVAARHGGISLVAKWINDGLAALHLPHANTAIDEGLLPKSLQYMADGRGRGVRSSPVKAEAGSMISMVPKIGPVIDKPYIAATDALNHLQFDRASRYIGDAIYEGDLAIARWFGQDISDPRVRQGLAKQANHAASWAAHALNPSRSYSERIAFTSAAMTRSGVNRILDMGKIISPSSTPAERIIAATHLVSAYVAWNYLGKMVNDQVGLGDWEFDPTKPGWGFITLPWQNSKGENIIVSLVPQDAFGRSVGRTFQMAFDAIRNEEIPGTDDLAYLRDTWSKYFLGRGSIVGQWAAAGVNYGFDPVDGEWKLGDYDANVKQRLMNLAPFPPWQASIFLGKENDPASVGLGLFGVQAFGESVYGAESRVLPGYLQGLNQEAINAIEAFSGKKIEDIRSIYDLPPRGPGSREEFAKFDPEIAVRREAEKSEASVASDKLGAEKFQNQLDDDARLLSGEIDPKKWRDNRQIRLATLRGSRDVIFKGLGNEEEKDLLDRFFETIDAAAKSDVETDWEKVDLWLADLNATERQVIADNTGVGRTPTEEQYYRALDAIDGSGYWAAKDKQKFLDGNPQVETYLKKWNLSPLTLERRQVLQGAVAEQTSADELYYGTDMATWRAQTNAIAETLAIRTDQIFQEIEASGRELPNGLTLTRAEAAVKEWGEVIEQNKMSDFLNEVNWAAVDEWLQSQPASVRKFIEEREREFLSPKVEEWKQDTSYISSSGYWDLGDSVLDEFISQNPAHEPYYNQVKAEVGPGFSYNDYWDAVRKGYTEAYAAQGYDDLQARAAADNVLDEMTKDFNKRLTSVREYYRENDPVLHRLLLKWDYKALNQDEKARILSTVGQ